VTNDATAAYDTITHANQTFDGALHEAGMAQNTEKQIQLPSIQSHIENRRFFEICKIGKAQDFGRYLGRQQSARNSNVPERQARLRAATVAWISLGDFWFAKGVPARTKRLVFTAHVQGAIVSAGESCLWGAGDYTAFDTKTVGYLRALMRGTATKWTQQGPQKLTNTQVYHRWRLVPCNLLLRMRRIKWYQDMLLNQDAHSQTVAALFGRCRFEQHNTLNDDGTINHEHANPWAIQFNNDICSLCCIDVGDDFLTNIWPTRSIPQLFTDPAIRDAFCYINTNELRSHFLHHAARDPHHRPYMPEQHNQDDVDRNVGEYSCNLKNGDGTVCDRTFPSLQQLKVHQVRLIGGQHGVTQLAAQVTTSNQCPFCMTVLACIITCRTHVRRALLNKCCPDDATHTIHALVTPDAICCKMCDESFGRYVDLQIHVRTHVDQVPSFVDFAIPREPYSLGLSARLLNEFRARSKTK